MINPHPCKLSVLSAATWPHGALDPDVPPPPCRPPRMPSSRSCPTSCQCWRSVLAGHPLPALLLRGVVVHPPPPWQRGAEEEGVAAVL